MKGEKTGGRKAGTPNKVTMQVRAFFREFVADNFETFQSEWDQIEDPKDKADIFIKACKFVIPALQSVSITSEDGQDKSIEEYLSKMASTAENKQ
jgi:hypothetical protein